MRSEAKPDPERVENSVSESVRTELESKQPSEEQKQELRQEHRGHLVRDTTSKLTVDSPDVGPGMELDAKAEVPDTYCFTCEEWIGVSGVDLRGTPRSRADAYYLGGPPDEVLEAKRGTAKTLSELADRLVSRLEHIEDREDAFEFIKTELEQCD
jgi:hypothetical protein